MLWSCHWYLTRSILDASMCCRESMYLVCIMFGIRINRDTFHQWARPDLSDALLLSLNQSSCFSTAFAMVRKRLVCIRSWRRKYWIGWIWVEVTSHKLYPDGSTNGRTVILVSAAKNPRSKLQQWPFQSHHRILLPPIMKSRQRSSSSTPSPKKKLT